MSIKSHNTTDFPIDFIFQGEVAPGMVFFGSVVQKRVCIIF